MKELNRKDLKRHNWMIKRDVMVPHDYIYSDAFRSLTKTSTDVLIRFLQKRTWDKGKRGKKAKYHTDPLPFTYREARALGISESQFSRSIRELIEKGFLKVEHQGGQFGEGRDWSRYILIDDWKQYGTNDFVPRNKEKVVPFSAGLQKHNAKLKQEREANFLRS